jgi:ubiquitin-like 1-activating enzyme E1 A
MKKMKRSGPAFPVLRILQKFRDDEKRDPLYKEREHDIKKLLQLRDELAPGKRPTIFPFYDL